MIEKPEMPDAIWAWYFMASKRDDAISGGWTDSEDRCDVKYLRSTPTREAAPDMLEALQAVCNFTGANAYEKARAVIARATGEAKP